MPIINFKPEFAELVASGKKRQTIRAIRKRPFKAGDKLYLYTGLRTKEARNLIDSELADGYRILLSKHGGQMINVLPLKYYVTCKEVHEIHIANNPSENLPGAIAIDGIKQPIYVIEDIAKRDGFNSIRDFIEWFRYTHGLPFHGQLVRW